MLQNLNHARIAHQTWVRRADHLISGLPVNKEHIPLEAISCAFGKSFLYGEVGEKIRAHKDYEHIMYHIETLHTSLHSYYTSIYKIYFVLPQKRSLLFKITHIGNTKEVTKKEIAEAQIYFTLLQNVSIELVGLLNKLSLEIKSSSEFFTSFKE